jgi:hypothetical protein
MKNVLPQFIAVLIKCTSSQKEVLETYFISKEDSLKIMN